MDAIGTLELRWAQGYDGTRADYIDHQTLCFKCGNNIKFVKDSGAEVNFPCPGEGVGPLAVHHVNKVFAFAEMCLEPKIYIFGYPSFKKIGELPGCAQLEYSALAFSVSDYLASISGIPEFQLTLWKYGSGEILCRADLGNVTPTSLSFNPANWRQVCVASSKRLSIYTTEQSSDTYLMNDRALRMPAIDNDDDFESEKDRDIPTRASTRMSRYTVDLPQHSIAGVTGEQVERFAEYQDSIERVVPVSHCWTPKGDLVVGCKGGQLLKVDGETFKVHLMYSPSPKDESLSRIPSAKFGRQSSVASDCDLRSTPSVGNTNFLGTGSFSCLSLHKQGLYAAGEDGILRILDLSGEEVKLIESTPLGNPITSLSFSTNFKKIACGSPKGMMSICTTNGKVTELFNIHYGNFVAVDTMPPGTDHVVSLREDGEVQIWHMESAKLLASVPTCVQALCLKCSPLAHVAVIGSASGHCHFVDLNQLDNPRLVHRVHLHNGPVRHIAFDYHGHFLVTGSNDGFVFVIDGRASTQFNVIGYTAVPGDVKSIACVTNDKRTSTKVLVTFDPSKNKRQGATKLMQFDISHEMYLDPGSKNAFASLKCDFRDEAINKMTFNFTNPAHGICGTPDNVIYSLSQNNKNLVKIQLPRDKPKKETSKDSYLNPAGEFIGHGLPGGQVYMSPHQRWIASGGTDGRVFVRAIGNLDRTTEMVPHDYRSGGIQTVAFSGDGQNILTTGFDGTMCCYKWVFSQAGAGKGKSAMESARARYAAVMQLGKDEDEAAKKLPDWSPPIQSRPGTTTDIDNMDEQEKQRAITEDFIYMTPTPTPATDATWMEIKELEARKKEDEQYAHLKKDLRTEIREMRKTLQGMMRENEKVPDIERLSRHEFDLDIEEQTRLQAEGEAEVQRIREEKEFENLAKMYLKEVIKKECWDDMVVKGRTIQAFNSSLEVSNYPMRKRSTEHMNKLMQATKIRMVELTELQGRREFAEVHAKPSPAAATSEEKDELNELDDIEGESKEEAATTGSFVDAEEETAEAHEFDESEQYGGGSEFFYSQFELHTREQKMIQITLLKDAIHRIRMQFNKEFDEVYGKKEHEIMRIAEKSKRIHKILADLDLKEDVYEPEMGVAEKPEMLLEVADSEVKFEKFLTPEQRKLEEEKKKEEERLLKEKGDNVRERALDQMMGGVLEIKKEDELKKDVPVPPFMNTKDVSEWSEDEQRLAKEYERKVKELQEEREKYRKQLEAELKKLQTLIADGTAVYDEQLMQLFTKKIKTEMVIYQEELKILRLKYSLLVEEELNVRDVELTDLLHHKRELKALSTTALVESKKNVELFRETYDILVAEDKVMDKAFKREFHDVPAYLVDQLYKLFRRRPRGGRALKGADTPIYDPNCGNPFSERPSTALSSSMAKTALEASMIDLDKESNMPEGVELYIWEKMCKVRKQKIDSEHLVKQKALVLAEMTAFLHKRQEEDEQLKAEIDDINHAMSRLRDDKLRFVCNLEVQLLLKQGQVEVDAGSWIHDFKDSILIHRSVVEDLNGRIRALGESKISSMVESKDFRKGIIQLEWEHKKNLMEMTDLQNQMRDIQNLKVTREIQAFLNETDHEAKRASEISILEQSLLMQKQHHDKNSEEKKRIYKELKKIIRDREEENMDLDNDLEDLNVSVNERKHIQEVNADKRSDASQQKRYQDIVQRRKLVDLAKAQAQEVAVLRAEVERLRMRTFPALVQVEH